jgi:putative ABC transport system substrate-binding protein
MKIGSRQGATGDSRKLKFFLCALGAVLFALCVPARAQEPPRIHRIGLQVLSARHLNETRIETFRKSLWELGYIEGKNVLIEYRYAEGKLDVLPSLASDLVQQQVDVIVTIGTPGVLAAKNATATIPIVFVSVSDPVAIGVVASLARPGGNVTGFSILAPELSRKRLELLKEAFPKVTRVVVLWNPTSSGESLSFKETQDAAKTLGVQLHSMEVRRASDFEGGFQRARKARVQALVTLPSPLVNSNLKQVLEFAAKNRLPAMYFTSEFVEAGGLMSYAPSFNDQFRRAATYVDKILKGAKPAELPVEQPAKFDLIVNLKTAKEIGLSIPPDVLARADRVIR